MSKGKKSWFAFPYILWIAGFTVIPLCLVLYYAFTNTDGGITLENIFAIAEPAHLKSLWTSLKMAVLTTLICFILAYPLGLILRSLNLKQNNFIIFLFILPMWMNFLLRTMAWQLILSNNGLLNNFLDMLHLPRLHLIYTFNAVLIGMVYDFLPFMILPVYNSLSSINNDVIEAGKDLGASYFTILRKIIFPLSLPGVISGITMVFVPSMTSFVISNILGGSNTLLIGNIIEQEFTYNFNWNLGSGLSFVLLVFTLISMALMSVFDKSQGENNLW
jgi:spermidine/putrescine transport system permease protein